MKSKRQTTDAPVLTPSQLESSRELKWVDSFTRTLDTKLRIPGTNVRFGVDFILGLVPGAGDLLSLGLSGILIATMAKNGASAKLVTKMLGNVLLDTIVGTVPVLGNLFDLFFKANYRNLELMREYYDEDKHRGSVWPMMLGITAVLLIIAVASIWLLVKLFSMIIASF
ncbi:DUF4112 domain-containing protein [Rubripirellula amarantea]|uniref:DUF4112 domain-containing protein n=1 Tax=Rubripirellula amarantea TaxID=2527999 RepID=A0A5C5WV29_9BACT|nr:DUF4112 domain-containing protein [Rubripirellula amarantea]MDA8746318.1 DUF4112 domain-containing protein [Rubripirellula amarantea]TWT54119.1 hypothetical protein Pla22_17540 [Rubripirellula amarantea]